MIISLIAAISTNRVIGIGNELPWNLPSDLQHFKRITMGRTILMGRKTWDIFGKPLPGRTSIVISGKKLDLPEKVKGFQSISEAIQYTKSTGESELMVIGGGEIYTHCLPLADKLYLTHVFTKIYNGTAFFPPVRSTEWKIMESEYKVKDEKNPFDMEYLTLVKK